MRRNRSQSWIRCVHATWAALALALASPACSQERKSAGDVATYDERGIASGRDSPRVAIQHALPAGDLLESSPDGRVLVGRALPVPLNSSARLVFEASLVDSDGRRHSLPGAGRIQDARFAVPPSRLIALLDEHDRLVSWDPESGDTELVDEDVFPGFAFSHHGSMIAYSKGAAPALDAWLFDLGSGARRQLTQGAPAWAFAFSPEDTRLVFVDSPDGFPCLSTMALDGSDLRRWTNRGLSQSDVRAGRLLAPYPDGRRPPLWIEAGLFVESSAGVTKFADDGTVAASYATASELHLGFDRSTVLMRLDGSYRRVP